MHKASAIMDGMHDKKPAASKSKDSVEEETKSVGKDIGNRICQCLQGTYEDTDGLQHASLIIALNGGANTRKIEVTTHNNGQFTLVSEEWCDEMTKMDFFLQER